MLFSTLGALQWNVVGLQYSRKIHLEVVEYLFHQIRLAPVSNQGKTTNEEWNMSMGIWTLVGDMKHSHFPH